MSAGWAGKGVDHRSCNLAPYFNHFHFLIHFVIEIGANVIGTIGSLNVLAIYFRHDCLTDDARATVAPIAIGYGRFGLRQPRRHHHRRRATHANEIDANGIGNVIGCANAIRCANGYDDHGFGYGCETWICV